MNQAAMLEIALAPALPQLGPDTEELCFNGPGLGWVLKTGGGFVPVEMPEMNYRRLHGVAVLAAAQARQTMGPRKPLMGGDLFLGPAELRIQAVIPPAVPHGTIAISLRRHSDTVSPIESITERYDISLWNAWDARGQRKAAASNRLLALYDSGDIEGFIRALVADRRTVLFCGQTGAGKTYLLKTFIGLLPMNARLLVIEDAREAVIPQPNHVRLIYSEGGLSGGATVLELMTASLRLRPAFVVLQEMRTSEAAWTFVDEVMSGHPGSPTTLHGATAPEAAKRLFNLVKGSVMGRSMTDATIKSTLGSAIDCIIPIHNANDGVRSIRDVWFRDHAERRGESFTTLLSES